MFFPGIMAMMSVQHQSTHNQREHPEGYCGFNTMAAEVKSVCVCVCVCVCVHAEKFAPKW